MKLASSPESSRQLRIDRLRRERAAACALRIAFPAIQQLHLELRFESSSANAPASQSHVLHPAARAFFEFPCPFADCDGGFDLKTAVDAALASKTGKTSGVLECSGQRPQPHLSRKACSLHLSYAIAATYQSDD